MIAKYNTQINIDGKNYPIIDAEAQKNLVYSQNEIDTGKIWIDGKKIYRKVATKTITTSGSVNIIDGFDVSLINDIISISGSIKQPSGAITPISYYDSELDGAFIYMSKDLNSFVLNCRKFGVGYVILIVEYTKTTN